MEKKDEQAYIDDIMLPSGTDLTREQSMAIDFIGDAQNEVTREGKRDLWIKNTRENREFFSKGNPDLIGLTAFVVAAGPSLDGNVQHLKKVSGRGVIVAMDASMRFLSKNGIVPEYCVMIDGSEKMIKMIEGVDTSRTMLVSTPSACPQVVREWRGPRFFVKTPGNPTDKKNFMFHHTRIIKATKDIREGDDLMLDENYAVEFGGVNVDILCGGNISTAAHFFSLVHIKAQQVVFVGLDLSWTHESHHYAGHEHLDNVWDRTKTGAATHLDVNGKEVLTNLSFLTFKRWHEAFARQFPGSAVNATEGGIVGINQEGNKLDCINFMTLEEAVAKYAPEVAR